VLSPETAAQPALKVNVEVTIWPTPIVPLFADCGVGENPAGMALWITTLLAGSGPRLVTVTVNLAVPQISTGAEGPVTATTRAESWAIGPSLPPHPVAFGWGRAWAMRVIPKKSAAATKNTAAKASAYLSTYLRISTSPQQGSKDNRRNDAHRAPQ